MQQKCHWRSYINSPISKYLSYSWQVMLAKDGTKMLSTSFINFLNQYISNISDIYNPNVNMSIASQTKCDSMFSDPKLDHIFSHYSVMYLVYIFSFSYVVIIHLLWIGKGVGIYCNIFKSMGLIIWIHDYQYQLHPCWLLCLLIVYSEESQDGWCGNYQPKR